MTFQRRRVGIFWVTLPMVVMLEAFESGRSRAYNRVSRKQRTDLEKLIYKNKARDRE